MDQVKIGKFIAACRKEQKLTQAQLAERLGVSDRAVSKWETGKCMPDSSIMLDLCKEINIDVNDLLNGRRIHMENYKEIAEQTMLQLRETQEQTARKLLNLEIVIGFIASICLFMLIFAASYAEMPGIAKIVLITVGILQFGVAMFFALKIEQEAGYYECAKCRHRYVPNYATVVFAMHVNRTRYMKCPDCGRYSWQKKVLTKEK